MRRINNYIFRVTTLSILFLITNCNPISKKSIEHYNSAQSFYNLGDYKNASIEIDKAINIDSTNYDFLMLKGKILIDLELFDDAIDVLANILNKNHKIDTVNFLIASSYFELGRYYSSNIIDDYKRNYNYENAINYYNDAISINQNYFESYVGKYKALFNLEKYAESLLTVNIAQNLYPEKMELLFYRGVAKKEMGDNKGFLEDLNNALESNQLDSFLVSDIYRFRGSYYYKENNYDLAITETSRSIDYNKKNVYAYVMRGLSYIEKGETTKACDDFYKAAELGYLIIYEDIKKFCNSNN